MWLSRFDVTIAFSETLTHFFGQVFLRNATDVTPASHPADWTRGQLLLALRKTHSALPGQADYICAEMLRR